MDNPLPSFHEGSKALTLAKAVTFLFLFASAFGSSRAVVAGLPVVYVVPLLLACLIFFWSGTIRFKLSSGAHLLVLHLIAAIFVWAFRYPFPSYFLASASLFVASTFCAFVVFQTLEEHRQNIHPFFGERLIQGFVLLSLLELAVPTVFESLRYFTFGLIGAEDVFIKLEVHYRRVDEMLGVRPQLLFSEPSHYGKFASVLIALGFLGDVKPRRLILYSLIFFMVIRSPSCLIAMPALMIGYLRTEGKGRNTFWTLAVVSFVSAIVGLYFFQRFNVGFSAQTTSAMERVVLPYLFIQDRPEVAMWGLGPGNLTELASFQCAVLEFDKWETLDVDCSKNPPAAYNALFAMLVAYGAVPLFFIYSFAMLAVARRFVFSFLLSMISVGAVMSGYNAPRFLILVALMAAAIDYARRKK